MNIINVFIVYDSKEKECEKVFNNLAEYVNVNSKKIKISQRYSSKINYDLYIILSNDIEKIIKTKEKYKIKENYLIFTSKLNKEHILECIKYTDYISFLNNPINTVYEKIEQVCEKI